MGSADGDIICKFHHRVFPGVSQLYVIHHQGEWGGAEDSSLSYASIDVYKLHRVLLSVFCDL